MKKIKKIDKFIKSMTEWAEFALRHNGRNSTIGQKALEQLKTLNLLSEAKK